MKNDQNDRNDDEYQPDYTDSNNNTRYLAAGYRLISMVKLSRFITEIVQHIRNC